jgi:hypothetical protein
MPPAAEPGLPGGFYCGAMDRKIVSGPVHWRIVWTPLGVAFAGESGRVVGSGL